MPRTWNILDALRVAALWLLVVSVFLGPACLGGSAGFALPNKTCRVSCPCEEAAHEDHADEHDGHAEADTRDDDAAAASEHGDDEPCKDECPDDCPNCGCHLGIAMAVLPLPVTSSRPTCSAARMLAPAESPASGTGGGVFRPPRSLI